MFKKINTEDKLLILGYAAIAAAYGILLVYKIKHARNK
jgi:hypothetical protein